MQYHSNFVQSPTQKDDIRNIIPTAEPPAFPARGRVIQSTKLMIKNGQYWVRTSDLFRVKEEADHPEILNFQKFQFG